MSKRVLSFINNDKYIKEQYPIISCYKDALLLEDNSFSDEEKIELFNYFFELRKEGKKLPFLDVFYFDTYKTCNPLTSKFFKSISKYIIESIETEVNNILNKDAINSKDILSLSDYIICLDKNIKIETVSAYINKALIEIIKILQSSKDDEKLKDEIEKKESEDNIIRALHKLCRIENLKLSDIKENIYKIIRIDNISKKLKRELSEILVSFLNKENNIKDIETDILLFIIYCLSRYIYSGSHLNSAFYPKIIVNIIKRIDSIDLLLEIFNNTFIKKDNIFSMGKESSFTALVVASRILELDISAIEMIEEKDTFFHFLISVISMGNFKVKVFEEEIDFSFIKDILFNYLLETFNCNNDSSDLYGFFIYNYVKTEDIYKLCTKEVKKCRILLSDSIDDFVFKIEEDDEEIKKCLIKQKKEIQKNQLVEQKIEENKAKYESIDFIKKFFNKKEIKKDIEEIKKEFNNEDIIRKDELYSLRQKYDYYHLKEKKVIDENFNIPVFNPFCIFYLEEWAFFYCNEDKTLDIKLIFDTLIENWNKYYILHLYNYLIDIKKYDYSFSPKEREEINNYFVNIDFNFPKYILVHLDSIFGFEIDLSKLLDDKAIIEILSYDYSFFRPSPRQVLIANCVSEKYLGDIIIITLEVESFDFTNIIKKFNKEKNYIFELCLENINIKDINKIKSYYLLLSAINIYNILDDKDNYKDKLQNIVIDYFKYTLEDIDNSSFLSGLLIDTVEKNSLIENILKLILNYNAIEIHHYDLIAKWQREIIFENLYSNELLNIIYEIRQKIRANDIEIKRSKNIRYNNKETQLENIKRKLSNINIEDEKEMLSSLSEICREVDDYKNIEKNIEYKHSNIVELLFFIYKDSSIFEDFCNIKTSNSFYEEYAINYFTHIFNNISRYKDSFIKITEVILNKYTFLEKRIEYPLGISYTPVFQLRSIFERIIDNIIKIDYRFDEVVYTNLSLIKEDIVPNLHDRIERKRKSFLAPIKIYKENDKYIIENKNKNTMDYDTKKECIEEIISRISINYKYVSRILEFEHLIKDIENKCITMSHPYLFEDDNENVYSINERLYISCFSYTTANTNAYAWWKIYGSKTKFRMTIDIRSFINSVISILDNNNFEIYLGSLEYKQDLQEENKVDWDFFDKREDFMFENELRLMVRIKNNFDNNNAIHINGLPVLCKFTLSNFDIYKNMSLKKKDIIFHPYDKTLLEKDKKAMLSILKNEVEKL